MYHFLSKLLFYNNLYLMQSQEPVSFAFQLGQFLIVVTLQESTLRIRAQLLPQAKIIFFTQINTTSFPDILRHTPLDSPLKFYQFIQYHQANRFQIHEENLIVVLEEQGPISIPLDKLSASKIVGDKKGQRSVGRELEEFKKQYFWDRASATADKYIVKGPSIKKNTNGWEQITSLFPLQNKLIHRLLFKIKRFSGQLSIGFGLIHKWRKNQIYSGDLDQQNSVGIWSKPKLKAACVCNEGVKVHNWSQNLYFWQGDVFEMIVDLHRMSIFWNTGRNSIEVPLKSSWKGKEIYVYCVIYNNSNEVELVSLTWSGKQ